MIDDRKPVKTTNYVSAEKFIVELISANRMGAIFGEKGSGKTYIKRKVIGALEMRKNDFRVIDITPMGEQVRNITQIMNAMVKDIAGEEPRRDTEARRRQLQRILGETREKIILSIDEAQDLHHSTLRGLKKLHELGFGTRDKLFTIVLFGQHSLKDKISDDELKPRVRRYEMRDLTKIEKVKFVLDETKFTETALAIFIKRTRNTPLAVEDASEELISMMNDLDRTIIDEQMVAEYFSYDLRDKIIKTGKSFRELSKDIYDTTGEHLSSASLNLAANGKYTGDIDRMNKLIDAVEKNPKKNTKSA
jgi:type II secretory pathway predicted ATPase ExeA